ncbi:phenylalanine--tRNA ligase subunit alpha [Mycoplasmopsis arginini]|uniref:phenylalanine--tRNA ligase n=1 Tax=Mycoplasmopsis arginini TaxID=2094 RepID=A0AA43QYU5_MYCAR|nr:phenylalanine--tRNA ligase subunit alpha [Mycoplasmopsis arginini]MCY2902811.1 phenylalanine--tRNA ligase subunit alpha [Mycoplasmopsis arginini QMP CG1-2758]MDI3348110.1 phenylalanine--tRNA ligase subunit alpha [Mycoplasmopsis arginini]MDI3348697.1 phenylalanine--tRNA ligase subunit alpha [Mycoplasmopsis arginini]MDI3349548.1 phenylalanine--tRNA ligase subunit alpha [Mycoplasmopsis arginini]MDI3350016.1 phenylalanine--tRNA ligase subunit alpha [Mycoplasmopsis arginini]
MFDLEKINNLEDLKLVKNQFNNSSELKTLMEQLKVADKSLKPEIGKKIQELKKEAEDFFEKAKEKINQIEIQKQLENDFVDFATPVEFEGSIHPVNLISERFREWLLFNGYIELNYSEIENDKYNFENLNIPASHPAREMQDSLYLNKNELLRTHNTGISARALERFVNSEFSQFTIGKVYRNDEEDRTHTHQFTQLDLVSIGNVSFASLMYTLKEMLSYVLEEEIKIRLRPSYFPFTEPSVEVDIFFKNRWIEVLGAGMLNEKVLKAAGYSNEMNGFAAGIGIERIAMIKYGIEDIRELYTNDKRFLKQFK